MTHPRSLTTRPSPRVALAAIVAVAFAVRIAWIAYAGFTPTLSDDAGRYDLLGRSLTGNAGFINPNGTTTMFWPPGYPFLLAAIYKLWPASLFGMRDITAALAVNAALAAATVALTYAVARRIAGGRTALIAAALMALFPSAIFFTGVTLSETLFTFVLMLAIWCALVAEERRDWRWLAACGLALGYASLVRGQAALLVFAIIPFWLASTRLRPAKIGDQPPSASPFVSLRAPSWINRIPIVGALTLAVWPTSTRPRGDQPPSASSFVSLRAPSWIKKTMVVAALTIVVIAPWTVRNWRVSGSPVLISTNAGVNFYIGHSPQASGTGRIVDELVFRYPELPQAEAEAKINNDGFREGIEYAAKHPLREVVLSAKKVWWLYYRDDEALRWTDAHGERPFLSDNARTTLAVISNVYYWLLIALAVAGVRRWFSLRDPARLLLISVAAYWTLVHVAFFADPRFHAPLAPLLCVWAACLIDTLTRRVQPDRV